MQYLNKDIAIFQSTRVYDMKRVIENVIDKHEFYEIMPEYA